MSLSIKRKRNDTGPPVRVQVRSEETQTETDFTGASFKFVMSDRDGNVKINAGASVESPAASSGVLRYDFVTGDLDTLGTFDAEFEVIFPGGRKETYPDEHYIRVTVEPDLEDA